MPLIQVIGLRHSFADGWDALNGINLSIEAGEYVALIGPNGSGKTTLAKHFNGLLRPTAGRVLVAGTDTSQTSTAELARRVGYVFQNPDHQIFCASVREEIAFAPTIQGLPEAEVGERVARELRAFELEPVAERPPAVLPPGLRRRVAVASVLAAGPDALVLDEPSVGLDAREQDDLFARVDDYNRAGHAVILISHDMQLVANHARRCLLLQAGLVVATGAPAEVLANVPALERAGMRPPAPVLLAQALGLPSTADIEALGEAILERQRQPR